MKSWKEHKIDYLEMFYGDAYKDFKKANVFDDRRLYVNIYEMIVKAINSLRKNPDTFVVVAMNHHIDEELEILRHIGRNFGRTDYIFKAENE